MTTTSCPARWIQRFKSQVVDQLVMSVFQPASVFGAPVRGRVVLTFSGISVRG